MCIIVAKPAGVEFPSTETLKNCWDGNPDGAGIMWSAGDRVEIRKGFMTWDAFLKAVKSVKASIGTEGACVMHFRIATHGEVSPECCHPFPLTGDLEAMRKTKSSPKVGIAHNGIIDNRNTDKRTSDTMDYIANFLYPLSRICDDWHSNKHACKLIDDTLGSKMCVLFGDGSIKTFGSFIVEDGCYFSNTSFRGYRFGSFAYSGGYAYGDDFKPMQAKPLFEGVCDCCDYYEECRYFGRSCIDLEDAVDCCFEEFGEEERRAILEGLRDSGDDVPVEGVEVKLFDEDDDEAPLPLDKYRGDNVSVYRPNWWRAKDGENM